MISPTIFQVFGFELRWYSVFILIAIFIAFVQIDLESKRFKIKREFFFNLMFWAIIIGIIGARLYYVIFNFDYYSNHPSEIIQVWNGGLAIHGGLIAGFITLLFYCKKYNANIYKILDICVPSVLLAQAVGRWGNFFNHEAFGSAVEYHTLVNMKIIPQFIIDNMYIDGAYHLPMFYFESLLCVLGFLIMLFIRRRKYIHNGQIFAFYLIWYGAIRFFIEIFRTDSLMLGSMKVAQGVSAVMILIGLYIMIVQGRKPSLEDLYNKRDDEIRF